MKSYFKIMGYIGFIGYVFSAFYLLFNLAYTKTFIGVSIFLLYLIFAPAIPLALIQLANIMGDVENINKDKNKKDNPMINNNDHLVVEKSNNEETFKTQCILIDDCIINDTKFNKGDVGKIITKSEDGFFVEFYRIPNKIFKVNKELLKPYDK